MSATVRGLKMSNYWGEEAIEGEETSGKDAHLLSANPEPSRLSVESHANRHNDAFVANLEVQIRRGPSGGPNRTKFQRASSKESKS